MTQTPGRTTRHHDDDTCAGEPRTVDAYGADAIRLRARRLIAHAEERAWPRVAIHADWATRHYGPPGDYFLCTLLAACVRQSPAPRPTAFHGLPQLSLAVPEGDPEAAALCDYLASYRTLNRYPLAQGGALRAARLPLQTFLLHLHLGDTHAARRQWLNIHEHGTQDPLTPAAFVTLLALWAARALSRSRQLAVQTAPFN